MAIRLLATYCCNPPNWGSWNIDSHQPDVNAWKSGRDHFSRVMGLAPGALNAGDVFWGGGIGQLDYQMQQVQSIYPNAADYLPVIGIHINDGMNNPATGEPYSWNDQQGYEDVANGLHDDTYGAIPALMKKYGRSYYIIRPGYENNASFMPDFCGYNNTPDQQEWFCKAVRRILWLQVTNARAIGGVYPMGGFCPTLGETDPDCFNLIASIGSDVMTMLEYDDYNNWWSSGSAPLPASGTPSESVLDQIYENRAGFGRAAIREMALQNGIGIFVPECGSGNGGDHVPSDSDNRRFWTSLADHAGKARAQGTPWWGLNVWSVPASDASCNMQDGSQPNNVADLIANIPALTGDSLDPASLRFGTKAPIRIPGSTVTPTTKMPGFAGQTILGGGAPVPAPTPSPTISPSPSPSGTPTPSPTSAPTSTPTSAPTPAPTAQPKPTAKIAVTVSPSPAIAGKGYAFQAVSDHPFSALGNIQWTSEQSAHQEIWRKSEAGVKVSLSKDGKTATIAGIVSSALAPHTAAVKDAGTGATSPATHYQVAAAPSPTPSPTNTHVPTSPTPAPTSGPKPRRASIKPTAPSTVRQGETWVGTAKFESYTPDVSKVLISVAGSKQTDFKTASAFKAKLSRPDLLTFETSNGSSGQHSVVVQDTSFSPPLQSDPIPYMVTGVAPTPAPKKQALALAAIPDPEAGEPFPVAVTAVLGLTADKLLAGLNGKYVPISPPPVLFGDNRVAAFSAAVPASGTYKLTVKDEKTGAVSPAVSITVASPMAPTPTPAHGAITTGQADEMMTLVEQVGSVVDQVRLILNAIKPT